MDEEEVEFEPEELLGKPFYFCLKIDNAVIPPHFKQISIDYTFKVNEFEKKTFRTKEVLDVGGRSKNQRPYPSSTSVSFTLSLKSASLSSATFPIPK